jgi:hypothetical protein
MIAVYDAPDEVRTLDNEQRCKSIKPRRYRLFGAQVFASWMCCSPEALRNAQSRTGVEKSEEEGDISKTHPRFLPYSFRPNARKPAYERAFSGGETVQLQQ